MFEDQFYSRLILNIIVGIMFVYALYNMARHNNHDVGPQNHRVMHVFGWVFSALSALSFCLCIVFLISIDFPSQLYGPFISSNEIIRPSSSVFIWGYPTPIQNSVLTMALSTFGFLGFGVYFIYFKKSDSSSWKKVLKFLAVVLLYTFMASATNFHYFDAPEFVAPVFFLVLWLIIVKRKGKDIKADNTGIIKNQNGEQQPYTPITEQIDTDIDNPIQVSIKEDILKLNNDEDAMRTNQESIHKSSFVAINHNEAASEGLQFCRFCGAKIEVDSVFCKQCGKRLISADSSDSNSIFGRVKKAFKSMRKTIGMHWFRKPIISINKQKMRKRIKIVGAVILGLMALASIGTGIYYYFDEVRPEQLANEILNSEKEQLNTLSGDALFWKCNEIIREHNIEKCGKNWRDRNNLIDLTALAWYKIEQLAYQKNANAQFLLGVKYDGYDFVEKRWNTITEGWDRNHNLDYDKAAYWYRRAAKQGDAAAQYNLGICYENGRGVTKSIKKAVYCYRASANNGNGYGMLRLGDCFRDGCKEQIGEHWESRGYYDRVKVPDYEIVLKQDIDSAKYYWRQAARHGNQQAKDRLQKIYE